MMTIRSDKDLKLTYELVKIYSAALENGGFGKPEIAKRELIEMKREIRRYTKPVNTGRRKVKTFDDGFIELIELPEYVRTPADAVQYFLDNIEIKYQPTYYDCTGQLFTNWIKVFRRRGRFMAYHMVSIDC